MERSEGIISDLNRQLSVRDEHHGPRSVRESQHRLSFKLLLLEHVHDGQGVAECLSSARLGGEETTVSFEEVGNRKVLDRGWSVDSEIMAQHLNELGEESKVLKS